METQELISCQGLSLAQIEKFSMATASLRAQAAGHANFGKFNLKEQPPGHFQDFREVYFPPTDEPSLDAIEAFCQNIMEEGEDGVNNFDRLRTSFRAKPETVGQAKEIMQNGGRILLITPHRELADIAMAMAALQCEIGDIDLVKQTRIFVGPILKELEIKGRDAIAALQFSSGVLVGIPDTQNTKKRIKANEIDAEVEEIANTNMLKAFISQCRASEISLVATAPSGSTDEEDQDSILEKSVSKSTDDIAKRYFDALLPVALVMDKSRTACEVGDMALVQDGVSLHDVMAKVMAPMYERVSGKRVRYEGPPETKKAAKLGSTALKQVSR